MSKTTDVPVKLDQIIKDWKLKYKTDSITNYNKLNKKIFLENKIDKVVKRYGKSTLIAIASEQLYPIIKILNQCQNQSYNSTPITNSITNEFVPVKGSWWKSIRYEKYQSETALIASIYSYLDNIDKIDDSLKENYKESFKQTVINLILCQNDDNSYKRLLNGSNLSLIIKSDRYKFEQFKSSNTTPFHLILINAEKAITNKNRENYEPFIDILKIICENLNLLTIDINEVDDWGFSGFYILTWYLINKKINLNISNIAKFIELGGNPFINHFINNFKEKINKTSYNSIINEYPKNVYELLKPNYPELIAKINESSKIFAIKNKKTNVENTTNDIVDLLLLDEKKRNTLSDQIRQIEELNDLTKLQEKRIEELTNDLPITLQERERLKNVISSINELQLQYQTDKKELQSRIQKIEGKSNQNKKEIERQLTIIEELTKQGANINTRLEELKRNKNSKISDKQKLQNELQRITAERNTIISQIGITEKDKNELLKAFNQENQTLAELQTKKEELSERLTQLQKNETESSNKISELTNEIKSKEASLNEQINRITRLEKQVEELGKTYNITGEKADTLEELINKLLLSLTGKDERIIQLEQNKKNLDNKVSQLTEQLKELNTLKTEKISLNTKVSQLTEQLKNLNKLKLELEQYKSLSTSQNKELDKYKKDINKKQRLIELNFEKIKQINSQIKEKERIINEYQIQLTSIRDKLKTIKINNSSKTENKLMNNVIKLLQNKNTEIKRLKLESIQSITELEGLTAQQRKEIEKHSSQLQQLQSNYQREKNEIQESIRALRLNISETSELTEIISNLESAKNEKHALLLELQGKTKKTTDEKIELERLIEQEKIMEQQLIIELEKLRNNNPSKQSNIEQLKNQISELQNTSASEEAEYQTLVQQIKNITKNQNLNKSTKEELKEYLRTLTENKSNKEKLEKIILEKNEIISKLESNKGNIELFTINYLKGINQLNAKELYGQSKYIVQIELLDKLLQNNLIEKSQEILTYENKIKCKVYTFNFDSKIDTFLDASIYILQFETDNNPKKKVNQKFINFFDKYYAETTLESNKNLMQEDFNNFILSIFGELNYGKIINDIRIKLNSLKNTFKTSTNKYSIIRDFYNEYGLYNINSISNFKEYRYIINNLFEYQAFGKIKGILNQASYILFNDNKIIDKYEQFRLINKTLPEIPINEKNKLQFIKTKINERKIKDINIELQKTISQNAGKKKLKPKKKIIKKKINKKNIKK